MKYIVYEYSPNTDGCIEPYINNVEICDSEDAAKEVVKKRLAEYMEENYFTVASRVYNSRKDAEEFSDSWIDICIAPAKC